MSVQSEITRLNSAKSAIASAISGKGVTVPSNTKLDGMASLISSIKGESVKNVSCTKTDSLQVFNSYGTSSWSYSSSISLSNGTITLDNASTVTLTRYASSCSTIKGKYISASSGTVYYIPLNATFTEASTNSGNQYAPIYRYTVSTANAYQVTEIIE